MTEAATTSFVRSMCFGDVEEDMILPFPSLDSEERETVDSTLHAVGEMMRAHTDDFRKWDVDGALPDAFIDELRKFGVFGLLIPEEHGGMELSSAAYSRVLQEVNRFDASVAVTVGAHSSIGLKGLLMFGTKDQRARYLPKLASGDLIAAFCLTEPGAGSDAASIKTHATRDGADWLLNGDKLWVTNGGLANFFTVFAKTGAPDERRNTTAFIVTKDMAGVEVGTHEDKMGIRASSTTTVSFDNVRVPAANVLGDVGRGFKVAMNILNNGRIGLGGGCVGAMKRCIEMATQHAAERTQFNQPIAEFGLVKQKLGHMVAECYAAEATVRLVAHLIDEGEHDYAVEAAISKVFATEALWRTADQALQIAGGTGYMRELPYERILRDSRINRIFEGTNEILRLFVALTAMNDVGADLKELAKSLKGVFNDPIKGFGVLSDYAVRRATLATGIQRGKSHFTRLHGALHEPEQVFESGVRDLALSVDRILRKHGRHIVDHQFATRRLADMMIDLFVLASVLSRVDAAVRDLGEEAAVHEVEIAHVVAGQVGRRVSRNCQKIDNNDDELIKSLANDAVRSEGFRWDAM